MSASAFANDVQESTWYEMMNPVDWSAPSQVNVGSHRTYPEGPEDLERL